MRVYQTEVADCGTKIIDTDAGEAAAFMVAVIEETKALSESERQELQATLEAKLNALPIGGELDTQGEDAGYWISCIVLEMSPEELESLPEFDGC